MSGFEAAFAAWIAFHSRIGVNIEATLMPPATEEDIRAVESTLGFSLPDDIRALYKIANGQYVPWEHGDELRTRLGPDQYWAPLFGYYVLVPLDQAIARYQGDVEGLEAEREFNERYNRANPDKIMDRTITWDVRDGDPVDAAGWNPGWFTFAWQNADSLAIDMNPPHGGRPGQIVEYGPDVARLAVLGSSLTDLLEQAAYRLELDEANRYERNAPDNEEAGTVFFDMDWRNEPYDHQTYLDAIPQFPIEYEQWQEAQNLEAEQRLQRFTDWLTQQGVNEENRFLATQVFSHDLAFQQGIPAMPAHVHEAMNAWSIARGDGPMPEQSPPDASMAREVERAGWFRYLMGLASKVIDSTTEHGEHISGTIGEGMRTQDLITLIHRYLAESGVWSTEDFKLAEQLRARFGALEIIAQGAANSYSMGFEGSVLQVCWSTFDEQTFKSEDFCETIDVAGYRPEFRTQ